MWIWIVGWPSEAETARSVMPGTVAMAFLISSADLAQRVEVGAVDLDRVLALHARRRFLDVVLDVLREGELDAREGLGQRLVHLGDQAVLVEALAPLLEGRSGTKNSALKKPVESVPSSGRPCWEITVSASGKLLISWRMRLA